MKSSAEPPSGTTLAAQFRMVLDLAANPRRFLRRLAAEQPILVPMLLAIAIGLAVQWASLPYVEQVAKAQMSQQWNPGQQERAWDFLRRVQLLAMLFFPLALLVKWAFLAVLLSLASQIAGGAMSLRAAFSLLSFGSLLSLLQSCQIWLILHLRGAAAMREAQDLKPAIGLNLFWRPQSEFAQDVLQYLNPLEIAYAALILSGTQRLSGFGWRRAAAVALPFWLFTVTIKALVT